MDTTYLGFAYMAVGIIIVVRTKYLDERLKRYIDRQYPEEAAVIRSHEWQAYPWSVGGRTLRALVKKQSSSDPELAYRAKKVKRSSIHFLAWLVLSFLVIAIFFIYHRLLTPTK